MAPGARRTSSRSIPTRSAAGWKSSASSAPAPRDSSGAPASRHDISELLETSHHDTSWVSRAGQGGWKRSPRYLVRDVHHPVRHGACHKEKRPGRAEEMLRIEPVETSI